jgi:hypothetical protein
MPRFLHHILHGSTVYRLKKNVKSLYTTGEAFQGAPVDRNIIRQYFSFFIVFSYLSLIANDPYKKIFFLLLNKSVCHKAAEIR